MTDKLSTSSEEMGLDAYRLVRLMVGHDNPDQELVDELVLRFAHYYQLGRYDTLRKVESEQLRIANHIQTF